VHVRSVRITFNATARRAPPIFTAHAHAILCEPVALVIHVAFGDMDALLQCFLTQVCVA